MFLPSDRFMCTRHCLIRVKDSFHLFFLYPAVKLEHFPRSLQGRAGCPAVSMLTTPHQVARITDPPQNGEAEEGRRGLHGVVMWVLTVVSLWSNGTPPGSLYLSGGLLALGGCWLSGRSVSSALGRCWMSAENPCSAHAEASPLPGQHHHASRK